MFRPWLPADTAAPTRVRGAIADMVDGWAREWFAGEPLRALGTLVRLTDPRGELRKTIWHVHGGGLAIGVTPAGTTALGAHVLGLAIGAERLPADLGVLERVGSDCLDALKRRAVALLGLTDAGDWIFADGGSGSRAVYRLDISNSLRNPAVVLELSSEAFAAFVKAAMPAPAPQPLGTPADALANLPVRLAALVGGCELTVAELGELAPGDVVVLDRGLDETLPLAIDGARARFGACAIVAAADGPALEITCSLAG